MSKENEKSRSERSERDCCSPRIEKILRDQALSSYTTGELTIQKLNNNVGIVSTPWHKKDME